MIIRGIRVPRHQSPVDGDIVPWWWRSSEDSKDPGGDDVTGDTGGTVDRFRLRLMGRSAHASPTDCDEGVVFLLDLLLTGSRIVTSGHGAVFGGITSHRKLANGMEVVIPC